VDAAARDETAIHDIGYRRYDGTHIGAAGAWRALYWQGLRSMFGIGKSAKAKILPVFVLLANMLPTLGLLAAASLAGGAVSVRYGQLIPSQLALLALFVAAQAPELLSRDQQHRVLPLLFTREVTRTAYATARLAAMATAVFAMAGAPLLVMYIGEIGLAAKPAEAFARMGGKIGPVLLQSSVTALTLSGIGAALAAWTPRRAYATAAIIGAFLAAAAIASGLDDLAGVSARISELLDPLRALRVMALILFDEPTRGMELDPPGSVWGYVASLLAMGAVGAAILQLRLRKVGV
jgi:ABC-2 type transport system permease protein